MSFWEKLGLGLKKSSTKISTGISDIFTKKKLDNATLEELEELLLTADIGVASTQKIIAEFSKQKQNRDITGNEIRQLLAKDIENILQPCEQKLMIKTDAKPYVILMVGVNGAGKTTTIGKLAAKLQQQGHQVSFIAADTFRAAAVEQLKEWAGRLNIRVFFGADGCDGYAEEENGPSRDGHHLPSEHRRYSWLIDEQGIDETSQHTARQHRRQQTEQHGLAHKWPAYETPRSSHKLHGVDGEPARIDVEPHHIIN